jgi:hypothetical protein
MPRRLRRAYGAEQLHSTTYFSKARAFWCGQTGTHPSQKPRRMGHPLFVNACGRLDHPPWLLVQIHTAKKVLKTGIGTQGIEHQVRFQG